PVHRRRLLRGGHCQRDDETSDGQNQPFAFDRDAPVGKQVDLVFVAAAPVVEHLDGKRARTGRGGQVRIGAMRRKLVPVAVRADRKIVVWHVCLLSVTWGLGAWWLIGRGTGRVRAPSSGIRGRRTCCLTVRSR